MNGTRLWPAWPFAVSYTATMFLNRSASKKSADDAALPDREEVMLVADAHAVLGTPMVGPFPDGLECIVFSMGCFWGPERIYWELDGVFTTAAGYAGGATVNATYDDVGTGRTGHAESVLVVFDPAVVELQALLALFWEHHDPTTPNRGGFGSQYRSIIFTTSPDQHAEVLASRDRYQTRLTDRGYQKIQTEIREADEFYYAEDRHQQYLHKRPNAFCANGFCQVSYK